jgi:tRNA dimethylallyltransferase
MTGRPDGVLAILGATASGKTALAVALAEELDGEVISADAFAAYRGLDAGTAKPSAAELARVPHHLIDVKDPREPYSAGEFAARARRIAGEVLERSRLPILCGGTGFYVRAFFGGLFEGPTRKEALRAALGGVEARRPGFLKRAVDLLDPASAGRVGPRDSARAIRLLEILFTCGERPSRLFADRPGERWERPSVKLLLTLPRPLLYGRIHERLRQEILPALPQEVQGLMASGVPPSSPGFSAIGYRDTAELIQGRISGPEWEERILTKTRHFAKRQETWFRREPGLIPVRADRPDLIGFALEKARPLFS